MAKDTYSLTFLGVGSGLNPALGNTNVLLESADGTETLLLDCGYTAPPRLKELGLLKAIRHIFITHVHMDHAGGLELLADFHKYVFGQKPHLYFPAPMYRELWEGSLRGGLEASMDEAGRPLSMGLDDYFHVHRLGEQEAVRVPGLPALTFRSTLHIPGKPAYAVFLGDDVYYSSDTVEMPPETGPTGRPLRVIYQDCQLEHHQSNVHVTLPQLEADLPPETKAKTWLMHYSEGAERYNIQAMGFAGFVEPMQRFVYPLAAEPVGISGEAGPSRVS